MLLLTRKSGERVVLFNKVTKEVIGYLSFVKAKREGDERTLCFSDFSNEIGVYREELYTRYVEEAKALEAMNGEEPTEKGLVEFIAVYDKGNRVESAISDNIRNT